MTIVEWILSRRLRWQMTGLGRRQLCIDWYRRQRGVCWSVFSLTMSLIYIKNRRGPRIEPCGTPAFIEAQRADELLLMLA